MMQKEEYKKLDSIIEEAKEEMPFPSQESDMGAVMRNLDAEEKLNKNTRLSTREINGLIVLEELQSRGLFKNLKVAKNFKELKISEKGLGRNEKVRIATAERESTLGTGVGGFFKNLFTRQQ